MRTTIEIKERIKERLSEENCKLACLSESLDIIRASDYNDETSKTLYFMKRARVNELIDLLAWVGD